MKFQITKRRVIVAGVILAALALVILPRLGKESDQTASIRLAPVVVDVPRFERLPQELRFSGHLKAETTTTVISKVPGKVLKILVKENQKVSEGQIVARIEDDVVRLQAEQASAGFEAASAQLQKAKQAVRPEELESAKASLAQAEESLAVARKQLDRTQNLFASGTVSKSRFEEAQNSVRDGETKLENARRQVKMMEEGARKEDIAMASAQADSMSKQLELARLQLDFATVRSPIAGTVAKIHVDPGNMVGQTSPLVTIVSDGTIFAELSVPEQYYGFFFNDWRNFTVKVLPLAYRDKPPFKGSITEVAAWIDGNTRTFEVAIAVENAGNMLRPGMYVDVVIASLAPEATLLVPASAVLLRNNGPVVFVTADDSPSPKVLMKEVTPGLRGQDMVQILKGLEPTDRVVVEGNAFLEADQQVGIGNQAQAQAQAPTSNGPKSTGAQDADGTDSKAAKP